MALAVLSKNNTKVEYITNCERGFCKSLKCVDYPRMSLTYSMSMYV